MAEQPMGKHMDNSGKKRRATILKGVIAVLLLVAVGCGGYVLYMNHLGAKACRGDECDGQARDRGRVEGRRAAG